MDNLLQPYVIWFAVGVILLLFEFLTPGLVTVFFGIGAWLVALICLFVDISTTLQLTLFLMSSVILLGMLRNRLKSSFFKDDGGGQSESDTMADFIGQKAVVTQEITPNKAGKIEFRGTYWNAEGYESIPAGASVEILDKQNITLKVRSLEGGV